MTCTRTPSIITAPFSYFDMRGECSFPSVDLVRANAAQGIVTALVLDANICLDLANYARGQKDDKKEIAARTFLLAAELTKVDVVPFFGCMELASNREDSELDPTTLSGIGSNVARALKQSEASLAGGHPVTRSAMSDLSFGDQSIEPCRPMLRYAYCSFLKITEIRMRSHLKARAAKNFAEFFDWSEAMECHVGLLSQAAFALFGGAKDAQKLLSLKNGKTPLDAAWGAAWDVWHCWMVQNFLPALPIDGRAQHCIFVTNDAAAAYIAGHCVPRVVLLDRGRPFMSVSELNYGFPYYEDKAERMADLLRDRRMHSDLRVIRTAGTREALDQTRVETEITRLEEAIMSAWQEQTAGATQTRGDKPAAPLNPA